MDEADNKPQYYYSPRFHHFNIYQRLLNGSSKKVDDAITKEEARRKVYKLNGWNYKPKEKSI